MIVVVCRRGRGHSANAEHSVGHLGDVSAGGRGEGANHGGRAGGALSRAGLPGARAAPRLPPHYVPRLPYARVSQAGRQTQTHICPVTRTHTHISHTHTHTHAQSYKNETECLQQSIVGSQSIQRQTVTQQLLNDNVISGPGFLNSNSVRLYLQGTRRSDEEDDQTARDFVGEFRSVMNGR